MRRPPLWSRLWTDFRERGLAYVIGSRTAGLRVRAGAGFAQLTRGRRTFTLGGRAYRYFYHHHNVTWRNERSVEVPWAWEVVQASRGPILEVGNVLSWYFDFAHDVIDKYETGPGIRNVDVVEFETPTRYALIVSISTLEHVGFDEPLKAPDKPRQAVLRLRRLLAPSGKLLVSMPLGWNPAVDAWVLEKAPEFDSLRFLKRVSQANDWREIDAAEARGARYGHPFSHGNVIALGVVLAEDPAR